jgi:hydrogenase/urease accessory protein HupE
MRASGEKQNVERRRRRARRCILHFFSLLACTLWLMASKTASAHSIGLSQLNVDWRDTRLVVTLTLARGEFMSSLSSEPGDARRLTRDELGARERDIMRVLLPQVAPVSCTLHLVKSDLTEEDGVTITFESACKESSISIDANYFEQFSSGHRQLATIKTSREGSEPQISEQVLFRKERRLVIHAAGSKQGNGTSEGAPRRAPPAFLGFVWMGVEHILTGYDHVLFLVALLLALGTWKEVAITVSAFTLAHSISLACATLGWFAPSPRLVEPLIALSVAYTGIENLFGAEQKTRWRLTLLFGLIHGFGFAGAMQEIALPKERIPMSLFGFNLGVELGQLAIVALVFPLLQWASKKPTVRAKGFRAASAAIAAMGVIWCILRLREA